MPVEALLLAGPVAVFLGGALVVLLLALRECDLALHEVAFPVHAGANGRVAFALHAADHGDRAHAVPDEAGTIAAADVAADERAELQADGGANQRVVACSCYI